MHVNVVKVLMKVYIYISRAMPHIMPRCYNNSDSLYKTCNTASYIVIIYNRTQ